MSMDGRMWRWGCLGRTIEHRANEKAGEIGLLGKVRVVWDVWGTGIIGPWLSLRVRHVADIHELVGGKRLGAIKRSGRIVERWCDRQRTGNCESFSVSV